MFNFDLSVIIPSINPSTWMNLYNQLCNSVGRYKFELIVVGPNFPLSGFEKILNFRFVRDFGSPSRCFQIGAGLSTGKYLCFIPDDITIDPLSFERCLDLMKDKPYNDGMVLRYDEGGQGQSNNMEYWRSKYHGGHKDLDGIKEEWKIAPCFLYNSKYFMEMGGLDCSFEHVNVNGHGLAHMTQANGGEMHLSPDRVFSAGWTPPTESTILYQAYLENDQPKFRELWSDKNAVDKYHVNFDNWKEANPYWPRRYK